MAVYFHFALPLVFKGWRPDTPPSCLFLSSRLPPVHSSSTSRASARVPLRLASANSRAFAAAPVAPDGLSTAAHPDNQRTTQQMGLIQLMHPTPAPTNLFLDTFQHYIGADNIERVSGMNVAHKTVSPEGCAFFGGGLTLTFCVLIQLSPLSVFLPFKTITR